MTDVRQKKWRIGKSVGSGAFGAIYLAGLAGSEEDEYAVKVEPHSNGPLWVEMHAFLRIGLDAHRATHKPRNASKPQGWVGIPEYFGSGSFVLREERLRFLVMSRLGSDIEKFFLSGEKPLPLATALNITIQILESLEYIHARNYTHNDVKAQNILLGRGQDKDSVFLVDLGLACKYRDSTGFHHDAGPDERKAHEGTLLYTSRDAHTGAHSRRGDLETLGYNLVHWVAGYLPWIHYDNPEHVQSKKIGYMYNVPGFLKKCFKPDKPPKVLEDFLVYVNSLEFEDAPNYAKLRKLLVQEMRKEGVEPYSPLVFGKRRKETRDESTDEESGEEEEQVEKTRSTRSHDEDDRFAPWSWEQVLCQDPESIIRQASRSSENDEDENPVKTAAFEELQAATLENPTPAMVKIINARMEFEQGRMNLSWMDQLKEYNNKAALIKAKFANMDLTPCYLTPAMQEVIDNRAKRMAEGMSSPITPDASEEEDNADDLQPEVGGEKPKRTNRKRAGGRQVSIATPTSSAASSRAVTPDSSRGRGSRRTSKTTPTASAASSRAVSPDSSRPNTPSSPFSRLEDPPRTPTPVYGERITRSRTSSRASSPEDWPDCATPTNRTTRALTRSRSATNSPVSRPVTPDIQSGRLEGIEELEEEGSAAKVFKKPIYTSSKVECSVCGKRMLPRSLQAHLDRFHPEHQHHETESALKRVGSPKTPVLQSKRIRDNRHYTPLPNQEQEILPRRRPAKPNLTTPHRPTKPNHSTPVGKPTLVSTPTRVSPETVDKEEECPMCTKRMPTHLIPDHFSDEHSPLRKVTRHAKYAIQKEQVGVSSLPVHVSTDSPLKIRNVDSPLKDEAGGTTAPSSGAETAYMKRRDLKL